MKKFLFALTAMAAMISCNDEAKVAGADDHNEHMKMAERNSQHVKDIYRAIETGDVSKIDTLLADDIVDHNGNMDGSDIVGKDSVKKMLSSIHNYFDNLKMEYISDATSANGDYHFVLVRMTGKAKENPWGMPVGMDMDDTSVDVMKIKDGKATDHWGFMSMKDIHEMMKGSSAPSKDTTAKR